MNLTNDMLTHMAIGAALALGLARYLGYLRIPSAAPIVPPPVMQPVQFAYPQAPTSQSPTYEAVINIPHKLAITPQVEVK